LYLFLLASAVSHIYQILAVIALALLLGTLGVGLWVGDYGTAAIKAQQAAKPLVNTLRDPRASEQDKQQAKQQLDTLKAEVTPLRTRHQFHFLLGVLACLTAILVNSIAVTYFIGTTKWIREVVETYGLSESFIERSNTIKKRTFPWAIGGMVLIILIAALGGMADSGGGVREQSTQYVTPHFMIAMLGTAVIGWSFYVQIHNIAANSQVIADVMEQVRAARQDTRRRDRPNADASRSHLCLTAFPGACRQCRGDLPAAGDTGGPCDAGARR
jgi:hypothetical protein